jgi:RHS repeat-associated protein
MKRLIAVTGIICAATALAYLGGGYDLTWRTIDAGGVTLSTGGGYELSATVGQPDAGMATGGGFELAFGFWPASSTVSPSAGACCLPDGECAPTVDALCSGGTFHSGATCGTTHCPRAQEPHRDGGCGNGSGGTAAFPFNGEFHHEMADLAIPGRGFDFVWKRTYRSKTGRLTNQGDGWDFSYNIYLEPGPPGLVPAAIVPNYLVFHDGTGRADYFILQPDGTWTRSEYFRVIEHQPDGTYTMTFADGAKWHFAPFDGGPAQGMILNMSDRNSNTMSFDYDPLGRLITIHDTLDNQGSRAIVIGYNADGFIQTITDWVGRQVRYAYYPSAGDPGGGAGDLKQVTSPIVVPDPNFPIPPGHEFPNGKTWSYTYSTGSADPELNHNLLTITDGRRNDPNDPTYGAGPYLQNIYTGMTNPADPDYDRVAAQIIGTGRVDFVYKTGLAPGSNYGATAKTFVNDHAGNIGEMFFDPGNRLVLHRQYTGRAANPSAPTDLDLGINPPVNPLRPDDPPFFENRFEWNSDSLLARMIQPNGNSVESTHDSSNPNVRARGNKLQERRLPGPLGGDQEEIVETWEYDPAFGGCCGANFVTRQVDPSGNETLHTYDASGNQIHTQYATPSIVEDWEYNVFGEETAHILPDNGSGYRQRDETIYHATGPQNGYIHQQIVDTGTLALTTTLEYDAVGNTIRVIDAAGRDSLSIYNQLNQVVRERSPELTTGGLRHETDHYFDANNKLVRIDVLNVDDQGVVSPNIYITKAFEYDLLGNQTRKVEEVDETHGVVTEFEYDANQNRTLTRSGEAVNGQQPTNVTRMIFDERNLPFRSIEAEGNAAQSTAQSDYDGNGNLVRVRTGLEDAPRTVLTTYDGYGRVVSSVDPMGNITTSEYDAGSRAIHQRTDGELNDVPGSAGNVRLRESFLTYDAMNRLVRTDEAFFDPQTQAPIGDGLATKQIEYNGMSSVTRVVDDNGHQALTTYDTANRKSVVTDHLGNTMTWGYDEIIGPMFSKITAVERSDLGDPDTTYIATNQYDSLGRLVGITDSVGKTTTFGFDSRDNPTLLIDNLGNVTRDAYDGRGRATSTTRILTDDGTGSGQPIGSIITHQEWDDNDRLRRQIDDKGNATAYSYDAHNRIVATTNADQTSESCSYDVHGNRLTTTDANGSVSTNTYDLNNRLTGGSIVPGPGVSSDTTFEFYQYDGFSRLIKADDDDSTVQRRYDSLGNPFGETLSVARPPFQTVGVISYAHDAIGNRLSTTYPHGRTVTATHDGLNRSKTLADQRGSIAAFDYVGPRAGGPQGLPPNRRDPHGWAMGGPQGDPLIRVKRVELGNATRTTFAFDLRGRLTRSTHVYVPGGVPTTIIDDRAYEWDAMSNKTRRADVRVGGPRLSHDYVYDSRHRVSRATVTDAASAVIRNTQYTLDDIGNRVAVSEGGSTGEYSFEDATCDTADSPVNQYSGTPFGNRRYDRNGNLIGISIPGDSDGNGLVNLADYSPFQQCVSGPEASRAAGCWWADVDHDCDVDLGDFASYQTDFTTNGGTASLRLTDPASVQFVYDYHNRLVQAFDPQTGQSSVYAYDALGRRIAKKPAGASTEIRYFYDGAQICEEQNEAGAALAEYVYGNGIDEVLTMRRGGADFYYHSDQLGNIMAITDAGGDVVERYEYGDYGQPQFMDADSQPRPQSVIGNSYLFTGREYDPETGFYYYRARYLDPLAGRFTTRDPIGTWGDAVNVGNAFTYVGNNPQTLVDPTGLVDTTRAIPCSGLSSIRVRFDESCNDTQRTALSRLPCPSRRAVGDAHRDSVLVKTYLRGDFTALNSADRAQVLNARTLMERWFNGGPRGRTRTTVSGASTAFRSFLTYGEVDRVRHVTKGVRNALDDNTLPLVCGGRMCPGSFAYVPYTDYGLWEGSRGGIHICPNFWAVGSIRLRAGVVLHEMTHKNEPGEVTDKGGTYYAIDAAGNLDPNSRGLTPGERTNHADSYMGYFMEYLRTYLP